MKKIISVFSAAVLFICGLAATAFAEDNMSPIYADKINEGTYDIEVDSSSSMFRIVECSLTVSEGKMTAVITLSGKGYGKLYMGTGEQALSADDSEFIYFVENDDGQYTYEVPVEALDKETDCAAWSIKKEAWYDRKLIFLSETLPDGAVNSGFNPLLIIIVAAAAAAMFFIARAVKK